MLSLKIKYDYETECLKAIAYNNYTIDCIINKYYMGKDKTMKMSFEKFKTFRQNKDGKLLINKYLTNKVEDKLNDQLNFLSEVYKYHLRIDNGKLTAIGI